MKFTLTNITDSLIFYNNRFSNTLHSARLVNVPRNPYLMSNPKKLFYCVTEINNQLNMNDT